MASAPNRTANIIRERQPFGTPCHGIDIAGWSDRLNMAGAGIYRRNAPEIPDRRSAMVFSSASSSSEVQGVGDRNTSQRSNKVMGLREI